MAWALKDPDGFGKYWPDGEFEGWDEQVEEYFNNGMSDEQKAQACNDGRLSMWSIAGKFHDDKGSVDEQESPKNFQTVKSYTELHSMIATESRVLAVDEDFKQLIEKFEPGVHQFFPFTITMPKGEIFPKQYFTLVIRQFIEGVIPKEGTYRDDSSYDPFSKKLLKTRYYPLGYTKPHYNKIHVSKEAIGSAHLWRDTRMTRPNVFISDSFQAAVKEAGLTIFRHHKVKEV